MLFERFSTLFILELPNSASSKPAKKESAKKHETRVWVAAWSPARELASPVMTDQTDALSSACEVTVTVVVCSVLHNCRCRLCLEWLQFILSCIFTLAVSFELSITHTDSRGGRGAKTSGARVPSQTGVKHEREHQVVLLLRILKKHTVYDVNPLQSMLLLNSLDST